VSYSLRLESRDDERDILIARLWELGTTGIVQEDHPGGRTTLRAFFRAPFPADEFLLWNGSWEQEEEKNWARVVMESWEPIAVGKKLYVAPDWRDDPTPEGRIRLVIHPGNAFGTGYHATTQMCLEALERLLRPADTVFDFGCGAAILAQAAGLLGATRILACDIDPEATAAALENLGVAGVAAGLFTGSAGAVRNGSIGLVLANITAETLIAAAAEIQRLLAPGGRAVLTGFVPERRQEVTEALQSKGLTRLSSDSRDGWACETL